MITLLLTVATLIMSYLALHHYRNAKQTMTILKKAVHEIELYKSVTELMEATGVYVSNTQNLPTHTC
jgi:hypothetical protein